MFINLFFYEAHFLFLVMFIIHITSTYIKLDTPYFHKVQIKIRIHCWPSSCFCVNNSNISQSASECTIKYNDTKANNAATVSRLLPFVYKTLNKIRIRKDDS